MTKATKPISIGAKGEQMANIVELKFEKLPVNVDKLHEELAATLGEKFSGVSTGNGQVRVHFQDDMPQAQQNLIVSIVAAHDAYKLTAALQAEADCVAKLDALRKPWAEWTTQDQADFVRILAERMGLIPA